MPPNRSNVRDREDSDVRDAETAHDSEWNARDAAHNAALKEQVGPERFRPEALPRPEVWSVIPEGSIPPPPASIVEPTTQEAKAVAQVEEAIAEMVSEFQEKAARGEPYGGDFRGRSLPTTPEAMRNEALRLVPGSNATAWVRYVGFLTRKDAWYAARDRHVGAHHGQRNDHEGLHRALGIPLPDDPSYKFGVGEIHLHRPDGSVLYVRAGLNAPSPPSEPTLAEMVRAEVAKALASKE